MKDNFYKNKSIIFLLIAGVIIIGLIFLMGYSLNFVRKNVEAALGSSSGQATSYARFEFEKLKEIGIITNQQ